MTTPTLMIGLGGTGRQTLMQVRRQFLEEQAYFLPKEKEEREKYRARYKSGQVPHVSLLSIDTDNRVENLTGEIDDPVLRAATLRDEELLNISISRDKVNKLVAEPNSHPHYRDWYDFSLSGTPPEHGCGMTRPWGRVAFFHNMGAIRDRIRSAIQELIDPDTNDFAEEIGVDDLEQGTLKIQMVFSVAGGTGSGMFLDTAYLVHRIMDQDFGSRSYTLESVILLPEAFSEKASHRVYANAYAALMEIEYYNRDLSKDPDQSSAFQVYWEGDWDGRSERSKIARQTFDASWIIGTESRGMSGTRAGITLSNKSRDKNALIAMMGDWLHLRCSPVSQIFGQEIDSYVISNSLTVEFAQKATLQIFEGVEAMDSVDAGFELSRRFGSFGMSKILAPSSLSHELLAHRLVSDIIGDWLQSPELKADVLANEALVARKGMSLRSDKEPLDAVGNPMGMEIFALSESIAGNESTGSIFDALSEDLETHRRTVCDPENPDNFEPGFREWRKGYRLRKTSDSDPSDARKGDFARDVLAKVQNRLEEDQAKLDEVLTGYLKLEGRGFALARSVLESLKADYQRVVESYADHSEQEAEACRNLDDDAEERLSFFEPGGFVARTVSRVCFDLQKDAFAAEVSHQIYEATGVMAKKMLEVVDTKLRELAELATHLRRIRQDMDEAEDALRNRPQSRLNKVIAPKTDAHYTTEDGRSFEESQARWALLPTSPAPNGPWPMRYEFTGAKGEQTQEALLEFAKFPLDHVLRNRTNVLHEFDQKFADRSDYVKELRPLLSSATSWAPVGHDEKTDWTTEGMPVQIGRNIASSGDEAERRVLHDQAKSAGFNDGVDRMSQTSSVEDQIVFEEHLTGVPIFLLSNLRAYRDRAYTPILTGQAGDEDGTPKSGLHLEIDIDKYDDLVRPDASEAKRDYVAMETFIKALVYGVVEIDFIARTGRYDFSYMKLEGLQREKTSIGTHTSVLRQLAFEGSALQRELDLMVQEAEAELWDNGHSHQARILALLDYYRRNSDHPLAQNRKFRRVCKALLTELGSRAGDAASDMASGQFAGKYDGWTREMPEGSGFLRLAID